MCDVFSQLRRSRGVLALLNSYVASAGTAGVVHVTCAHPGLIRPDLSIHKKYLISAFVHVRAA